jgi:hypothetical protein
MINLASTGAGQARSFPVAGLDVALRRQPPICLCDHTSIFGSAARYSHQCVVAFEPVRRHAKKEARLPAPLS